MLGDDAPYLVDEPLGSVLTAERQPLHDHALPIDHDGFEATAVELDAVARRDLARSGRPAAAP